MGKVKARLQELEELNGPFEEPSEEDMAIEEPSDAELAEIENQIDNMSWEDMSWEQLLHSVTIKNLERIRFAS